MSDPNLSAELAACYARAQRHLARRDAILKQTIRMVGACTLRPNPDRFGSLVSSIISQQISTKAAASIKARLHELLHRRFPGSTRSGVLRPKALLDMTDEEFRQVGLSSQKTRYIRDLAEKVHTDAVKLRTIHKLSDEEVIEALLPIKGVGRWTAEMFLIFSLGRLDVLPVDDLGFRAGVQLQYGLAGLPKKSELIDRGESWRPYRSIATWYFWRSLHLVRDKRTDESATIR